jgi:hypothetical protein
MRYWVPGYLSGIALSYGSSSLGRGWEFFSSPPRSDRFWDPHSLLSNEYRGLLPWDEEAGV